MDARKAHHAFRDIQGDFVSYVRLFRTYTSMKNQERFCKNNYLDEKVMYEIANIKQQLEEEVAALGIPITGGGSMDDYLCCIAAGMIQFVCVREGRENYRSLTADHISIHPGSSMFRNDPLFIVAGEIVRTSRMFAMSVSPLTRTLLARISPDLEERLNIARGKRGRSLTGNLEYTGGEFRNQKGKVGRDDGRFGGKIHKVKDENIVSIGGSQFELQKVKGKKILVLPFDTFRPALLAERDENRLAQIGGLKGKILLKGGELLTGEKVELICKLTRTLNLLPIGEKEWPRGMNVQLGKDDGTQRLIANLDYVLRVTMAKAKSREYGFICLYTDGKGTYWFKVSRGFPTALNESLSSLETLIDEATVALSPAQKEKVNIVYRVLNSLYD